MKARHYDIALIVGAAGCMALFAAFDTDQAKGLFSPTVCFWMKTFGEVVGAMSVTAQAFRHGGKQDDTPPDKPSPQAKPPVPDGA